MVGNHVIKNGEVILTEDATVNVTNREVQFSFSVYESIRVIKKRPVFLADHLKRLKQSAEGINLKYNFSDEDLKNWVVKLIEEDQIEEATMRILVIGGTSPKCFISAQKILKYPSSYYDEGIKAFSYNGERLFPCYKTSNLLLSYVALESAKSKGGFEAVFVDRNGLILEGTRSNFYAFSNNVLYTASDEQVLEGVTRTRVLKAAKDLGYEVVMRAPALSDILSGKYEEAFLSSTSMATMALKSLDGYDFKSDFSKTKQLNKIIRDLEKKD